MERRRRRTVLSDAHIGVSVVAAAEFERTGGLHELFLDLGSREEQVLLNIIYLLMLANVGLPRV